MRKDTATYKSFSTLFSGKKHFGHVERSYLLLLCGIGYNVIK